MSLELLKNKFYDMEIRHRLFDRIDANGIHYWDIFRFHVFVTLFLEGFSSKQSKGLSICKIFDQLYHTIRFLINLKPKRYFIFVCSRNKIDGNIVDQQMLSVLKKLDYKTSFIIESFQYSNCKYYKKQAYIKETGLLYKLFSFRTPYENFKDIADICNLTFDTTIFSASEFLELYKDFYAKKRYFEFLFRKINPQKIFISQNDIQKGLFYAARELHIPVYEFQHGIVYDGHMAYSYPAIQNLDEKTYLPTYILKLSDYWFSDFYTPSVNFLTLGNNYFVPKITDVNNRLHNSGILVVSSKVHGQYLVPFLKDLLKRNTSLQGINIIYKLHPNEFNEYRLYESEFQIYNNVKVLTNEKNVTQCLALCNTMLVIMSTAAYEALQLGRKVIVLKEGSFESMMHLNSHPNFYSISTVDEFSVAYDKDIEEHTIEFFAKENSTQLQNILK